MGRRATGKQNKDLTHKDVEEALYKFTDLQLNLRHLSDILSVVGLDIGAAANLDRARHRIQLCATDKLHGTLIEIELIVQPAGVLDKTRNVRLGTMSFSNRDKVKSLRASSSDIQTKPDSAIQIVCLWVNACTSFPTAAE